MGERLQFLGIFAAGLAGAGLVMALVDGPVWLVVPGALGAVFPAVTARRPRLGRPRGALSPPREMEPDPS